MLTSQRELISAAMQLGAETVAGWSPEETALVTGLANGRDNPREIEDLRAQIRGGDDPLGSAFINLRAPSERRALGATYTPYPIVRTMLAWARAQDNSPERIID